MYYINDKRLNPNPITKFFVVVLLGFTVVHSINHFGNSCCISDIYYVPY